MQPIRVSGHQGTPEWLDNRLDVVGSSDIPVITGSSPFKSTSLFDLWALKARQIERSEPTTDDESEDRRKDAERYWFGHAIEPVIADRLEIVTGWRLRRVKDQLRHATHGWVGASLDRVKVGERRIVEIKWVPRGGWGRGASEPIPDHVQDQVQWQLLVRGWDLATVAVLDGDELRIEHMEADAGYQDDLMAIAHDKLWKYVLSGDPPPVDGSEATQRALQSIAQRRALVNGVHLDGRRDPDLIAMAMELHRAKAAKKAAEDAKDLIDAKVKALLIGREATGIDGIGWRIDWHQQADTKKRLPDMEKVAGAYRGVIESALLMGDLTVRGALRDLGLDPDAPDVLDQVVEQHTADKVTRKGARPLAIYVKDEEARKWQ